MLRIKPYLLISLLLLLLLPDFSFAQNKSSQQKDSFKMTEALLLGEQQQQQIDSLIKLQLEKDLKIAIGDNKKTQELEEKLRQITSKDSIRKVEQLKKIQALKEQGKGFPVVLNLDTILYIYTRTGSFNAQERAANISRRIRSLYEDPFYTADSLTIIQNEDTYELSYKQNEIIMSVSNLDGLWMNKSTEQLAKDYLEKIKSTIAEERREHSLVNLLKRIGLVILVFLFLGLMIYGINRLFKKSATLITQHRSKYINGLKIGNAKLFSPTHVEKLLLRINRIVRIIVTILLVYLSLPLLFSIFPETERWTDTLLRWILSPLKAALNGIIHYLPNLFTILVIYYIFKYAVRGVRYFFVEVSRGNIPLKGFHPDWAIPTFNILRFILYAFMMILIFPYLPGSSSPAFQGVSVFLGILISLGSTNAITNIVAGLVITYMRPFKVGDRVKIGDVIGDVTEKTMLVTRIKTIKNEDITVPNSNVLSSSTINYSTNTRAEAEGLIINNTLTLGYDLPWAKIHELLIRAALKTEHVLQSPRPFVLQTSLDDFYVSYQINAYIKEANKQAEIYSNLFRNILDVFQDAGVEILSPHYRAVRDGNTSAVPGSAG